MSHTHDDDVGHALEGGLFDFGDAVIMDAQLLQALGHVGGHVLEGIPGQVETLQLGERAEGLVVNGTDLVVYQNQSLCERDRKGVWIVTHVRSSLPWVMKQLFFVFEVLMLWPLNFI